MADGVDVGRLQELERRLATLEGQTVHAPQGSQTQGERVMDAGQQQGGQQQGGQQQGALLQAFLQGQMVGQALAQAASQAAQAAQQGGQQQGGQQQGGAAPQFLSLFACDGGWTPTNYDSIFWCRSRFMCNPQSLSCLC
jgi:hypothetical protein